MSWYISSHHKLMRSIKSLFHSMRNCARLDVSLVTKYHHSIIAHLIHLVRSFEISILSRTNVITTFFIHSVVVKVVLLKVGSV